MQGDRRRTAKVALAALVVAVAFWAVLPGTAYAMQPEEAATLPYSDLQFVLSSFSFLVWGALVMWMCAGFTMLEAGSVRTKNASMICLKNVGIYSIAALSYFFVGYGLMYVDVDGFIGTLQFFPGPTAAEATLFDGATDRVDEVVGRGHASMSNFFFQTLFVATAASIVSGAILERVKLWAFWAFTLVMTAVIYPVAGSWVWGGGWLQEMGFQDFAGSTVVHAMGGCAALAALLMVGPRRGKFRPDGSVKATPPSNVLVVTLGVLILWLGWFGFNGGSVLALATPGDAVAMSSVLFNTNIAAASGLVAAVLVARPLFGRLGLASSLNGALAGVVSITAGPNIAESYWAVVIGAVGGLLCSVATWLMERMKLDDVVGAIPVHLVAGVWGTLAASIAAGADFGVQLLGVASVAAFAFGASFAVWMAIDLTVGIRVSRDVEFVGQDVGELGIESHPEFVLVPEEIDDYQQPLKPPKRGRRRRGRPDGHERPEMPGERLVAPAGAPPGQHFPPVGAPTGHYFPPVGAPPGQQHRPPATAPPGQHYPPAAAPPGQQPPPSETPPAATPPGQQPRPPATTPPGQQHRPPATAPPGQHYPPAAAPPGQQPRPPSEAPPPGQQPRPPATAPPGQQHRPPSEAPPPGRQPPPGGAPPERRG
ncbi:MAG: hypothetical protein OXC06_08910 [Acidimicrobiaceae bacterium]|nr:hypothetical protein [Acidimicrobiaceae bacterium]